MESTTHLPPVCDLLVCSHREQIERINGFSASSEGHCGAEEIAKSFGAAPVGFEPTTRHINNYSLL